MKKYILLFILSIALFAQAQNSEKKPNVQDLHEKKWQFMEKKAALTADEAEKAKPIFMEYEKSVWNLMDKNKGFYHKQNNETEKSNLNYEELNDRYVNFEIQKAHLLKMYYAKLRKILPAESIFKLYSAERLFKRELMNDWHGKASNRKK